MGYKNNNNINLGVIMARKNRPLHYFSIMLIVFGLLTIGGLELIEKQRAHKIHIYKANLVLTYHEHFDENGNFLHLDTFNFFEKLVGGSVRHMKHAVAVDERLRLERQRQEDIAKGLWPEEELRRAYK